MPLRRYRLRRYFAARRVRRHGSRNAATRREGGYIRERSAISRGAACAAQRRMRVHMQSVVAAIAAFAVAGAVKAPCVMRMARQRRAG